MSAPILHQLSDSASPTAVNLLVFHWCGGNHRSLAPVLKEMPDTSCIDIYAMNLSKVPKRDRTVKSIVRLIAADISARGSAFKSKQMVFFGHR